jgi:subtilase family serine protease
MLVLLAALTLPLLAMTSTTCADPAIVKAVATTVAGGGPLTTYDVAVTVENVGLGAEPASLLQSVAIYQDATKVGQVGTPPLRPGQRATVHYRFQRSSHGRSGSTHLRFALVLSNPHGVPVTDCSTRNDTYRIDV